MRRQIFGSSAAVLVAAATPAFAADDKSETSWTLSSGIDYSSGKYGLPQGTDILVGLSDITLKTGDFKFSACLPYLNITGPAYVVVGAGGVPTLVNPARGANTTVRGGWGDLNVSGVYSVDPDALGGFSADLTARVKIATADASKGLSSGESDFGFSVDVSRQIDIWSPSA